MEEKPGNMQETSTTALRILSGSEDTRSQVDVNGGFELPYGAVTGLVVVVEVVHEVGHVVPAHSQDGRVAIYLGGSAHLHALHRGAEEALRGSEDVQRACRYKRALLSRKVRPSTAEPALLLTR